MAKSPRASRGTRTRRTVREELSNPTLATDAIDQEEREPEPEHEDEPSTPKPKTDRLSLPLTPDGSSVDWERVRNPERARTVLGIGGGGTSEVDGLFGADMLGLTLDVLGGVLVNLAKAGGYTPESAELMRFGEKEKEAIQQRAIKVLNKHAPTLGKWEDEIMLGATLSIVLGGKIMTLKKAASVSKFPRAVETPEPAPTTITPE